ncbi:hypothetical protein ACJIZ3_001191 [Penstemon smallii]|uniref:J domain-containing protein n=1 Tax=Penstemon smallii TaxID=265156 RepID=A0ABD3U5A9_9LAMI
MEHPFFPTTTTRAEALRWLTIAEKLLSARDLMGSKSFATRARDADPTLSHADLILAVVDTLLAGDHRIGNNQHDLYAILRLTPLQGHDTELIANQYRSLALLLNPQNNRFPFADQAFRLVVEAWSLLSNPSRKSMYDKELAFYMQQQQQQQHHQPDPFSNPNPAMQQNFIFFGGNAPVASNVAQPQLHVGGSSGGVPSHFAQVQQVQATLPQVEPVGNGLTREVPQNFMNFTSGSNLVFGSRSSHEQVNKPLQENFPAFVGGGNVSTSASVASASGANQEQVDNNINKQKQPQENYSYATDKTNHNVNVSENVGESREDEEELERLDIQEEDEDEEEEERVDEPENNGVGSTFWTACPYCYYMYEYPSMYVDCSLRCQNCKCAFQGVVIPSPPPIVSGQEEYFCCWGFLPLGFSMENWEKNKGAASAWTPFSPMFSNPHMGNITNSNKKVGGRKSSGPRVYIDDDDIFVELSESGESDDEDWRHDNKKKNKKAKSVKGKGATGMPNKSANKDKGKSVSVQDGLVSADGVEMPIKTTGEQGKRGATSNARKQPGRIAKNYGKLDLNVEFSNEAEEPAQRVNPGNGTVRGEDDNIEGIGFFEGLDEFLSSLPILNAVGDDKVVKAA